MAVYRLRSNGAGVVAYSWGMATVVWMKGARPTGMENATINADPACPKLILVPPDLDALTRVAE
jgi:hypothetical protein